MLLLTIEEGSGKHAPSVIYRQLLRQYISQHQLAIS